MNFIKNIFSTTENNDAVSKVVWKSLTELSQLNEIIKLSNEKSVVIFKHSTRCHISRTVLKQFEKEFNSQEKIIPYFLNLLEHSDISNEIAIRFGVEHQSPQIIVIKDGKAVYNASHESIEASKLTDF